MRSSIGLFVLAALALGPLGAGCSLLGLDRLDPADCDPGPVGDAFCASLADIQPTGDACLTWQCNEGRHCEIAARDDDGDGAPVAMCEPLGVVPDCDDAVGTNAPGSVEICDGLDNDCNDAVDDDAVSPGALVTLRDYPFEIDEVAIGSAPDADESILVGLSPTSFEVAIVTDAGTAGLTSLPIRTASDTMTLNPTTMTAAIGLGSNRYALMLEVDVGICRRPFLGIYDPAASAIRVADAHSTNGFTNAAGDCASGPTTSGGMALDPSGDLLVAYLEGASRECGTPAPVPVRVVGVPGATPDPAIASSVLGQSVDSQPPAVLALGGREFLVGFPADDGTVEVHRVTLAAGGATTSSLEYTEPADAGGNRNDVRLALGPSTGGTTTVALAYAYGCGTAPVAARLLSVTASGITAGVRVEGTTATGARLPAIVYQPTLDEWLLAWRTRNVIGGLRIGADSMAIGGGFDLVAEMGGYDRAIAITAPARAALMAYRLVTVRMTATGRRAVASELGCLPMP